MAIGTSELLRVATAAAEQAGKLIASRVTHNNVVNAMYAHDVKLAVDVESQDLISGVLLEAFPDHGIIGEEGTAGNAESPYQWIVDPIDGTVNFFYGIPHFCVSIALQYNRTSIIGVIYDPMVDELWTVSDSVDPQRNGKAVTVSGRRQLSEALVSVGFAKRPEALEQSIERYRTLAPAVRKIRMLGSAALEMAYVASGRLDAYIEEQVSIWDIAAGCLLVERAGGKVALTPHADRPDRFSIVCSNGLLPIEALLR